MLGIVYCVIATHLIKKAGHSHKTARTGAATPIQRFGSALNLNIRLMCMDAQMPRAHGCAGAAHMLFLDGVYVDPAAGVARFRWAKAPTSPELTHLAHTIAHRVGRFLERLCRYISRPVISDKRLSLARGGNVRYQLKTPYRDGTTHVAAPAHPALAALVHPCTSSSSHWTSSQDWRPWCRSRV